jgi:hypothetical protein
MDPGYGGETMARFMNQHEGILDHAAAMCHQQHRDQQLLQVVYWPALFRILLTFSNPRGANTGRYWPP